MARYTAYVLAVLNSVSTSDAAFLSPSLPSPFHASSNLKIPRQHPISRKQLTATSFGPRPLYMSNVGGDDRNNGNNSNIINYK